MDKGGWSFVKEKWMFAFVELQAIHIVHRSGEGGEEAVALFRKDGAVEAGDEDRDTVVLHGMKSGEHTVEDMPDFAHGSLFVVQRIEQPQNDRGMGIDGLQERWKQVRDRLLHLIAGEAAGDMDPAQQTVGVLLCNAGGFNESMHVEPVAAVGNGNRHSVAQNGRCNGMGKLEDRLRSVQEIQLSRRPGELPRKERGSDVRRRSPGGHDVSF